MPSYEELRRAAVEEQYRKQQEKVKKMIGKVTIGVASVLGIFVLASSVYTIDSGERGVLLRNGAVTGTAEPGLGFKVPMIDHVRHISVQTQSQLYEGILTYSRDQQTAALKVSVTYRLPSDKVESIYTEYGGQDGIVSRLLDRQVQQSVKNVFGQYNAVTAIQDRSRLVADIQTSIQSAVVGPIIIESVQLENIDFSDAYESSIEARMLAEVEVQKVTQNAEREKVQAQIAVIQAQAKADAQVAAAKAEAEAITLRGSAEADAIRNKGAALKDNPSLVSLIQAERWDGKLPTTMVPGSTVPFMNMGK